MSTDDHTSPSAAIAPVDSKTEAAHLLSTIVGILLVGLGAATSVWRAKIWSGGALTSESLGYAVGSLLMAAAIAYAIAGRRKVRNWFRFSLWLCGFCLLFLLLEVLNRPQDPKKAVGRLMREVAGTAPVSKGSSPMEDLERASMRIMLDFRRAHDSEVAKYSDNLSRLYTAESFSSVASRKRSAEAVKHVLSADQTLTDEIGTWPDMVRQEAAKTSLSAKEQADFARGATNGLVNSSVMSLRKDATNVEAEWAAATLELYSFAERNSRDIVVSNAKIVIANATVRTKFNELLTKSEELRKNLQEANKRLHQAQAEVTREYGVTEKDLGLADNRK